LFFALPSPHKDVVTSLSEKMGCPVTRDDIRARTAAEKSPIVQHDNFNGLKSF